MAISTIRFVFVPLELFEIPQQFEVFVNSCWLRRSTRSVIGSARAVIGSKCRTQDRARSRKESVREGARNSMDQYTGNP